MLFFYLARRGILILLGSLEQEYLLWVICEILQSVGEFFYFLGSSIQSVLPLFYESFHGICESLNFGNFGWFGHYKSDWFHKIILALGSHFIEFEHVDKSLECLEQLIRIPEIIELKDEHKLALVSFLKCSFDDIRNSNNSTVHSFIKKTRQVD